MEEALYFTHHCFLPLVLTETTVSDEYKSDPAKPELAVESAERLYGLGRAVIVLLGALVWPIPGAAPAEVAVSISGRRSHDLRDSRHAN